MNTALSAPENKKKRSRKIPDYLVYEELNGRKLYRKGYRDVLSQTKKLEDIIGSSSLQGIIISLMLRYLYKNLDESQFEIITNEIGLHHGWRGNLQTKYAFSG